MEYQRIGLDLGTKTIVSATRAPDGTIKFKQEINGFFIFPKYDAFTKEILIQQKIPFTEKDGKFVALGSRAEKFAYAMNATLQRPMADGTVSREEEAINIMATIIQALLGKLENDAILYYCIPANAINRKTNVQFHDKVAKLILDSYKRTNAKIISHSINEARAIAISSGIEGPIVSCSFGAGMVNVCYTMYGVPIFEFSLVGSGDLIDIESAKQFGFDPDKPELKSQETPTSICQRKHSIDLRVPLDKHDRVNQVIALNYQILIENVVGGIISGFEQNIDKARIEHPVPIVIAGGTASPPGFQEYFETVLKSKKLPFEVESVKVLDTPLYKVAEGCLIAASLHEV